MFVRYTLSIVWVTLACFASLLCGYALVHAASINATITTGVFVPLQPLNLAVSIGDRSVDLSWSHPSSNGGSSITDYIIEYRPTSGGAWIEFLDDVSSDTSATVTDLLNDESYEFRVSAVNGVGQGNPSALGTGTPGAPLQVLVTGVTDTSVPSILTGVRITNEGGVAYNYHYTWCITNADTNLCGGGNDIVSASAATLVQPSEIRDISLPSTLSDTGTYWFHIQVDFGSDSSYASQVFTAVREESSGSSGGSSGSKAKPRSCVGGDANRDSIINLIDFSVFLFSFNKPVTTKNTCSDINQDGKINMSDFSILINRWGMKPAAYKRP